MLEKYRGSALRTMSPLEKQAHGVLTPFCFKKFQEEFGRATLYSLLFANGHEFVVRHYEKANSNSILYFGMVRQLHVVASTLNFGEFFAVTF